MTRSTTRRLVCGFSFAILLLPDIAMVAPRLAPRAEAAFPGRNGRIAFSVTQVPLPVAGEIDGDLFTVSPSGHGLHRVTESRESDDFGPAWSPDGRRIAFTRRDPISTSARDIYVIDATGGQVTNLTASPLQNDYSPSWSPDGTKIVFASEHSNPTYVGSLIDFDLYVMDSDGGNVVQLTDDPGDEYQPAWSPQGDVIAYIRGSSIRLIRPDGSDVGLVFGGGSNPPWSPDGRRITFAGRGDVWVVNRDGSGLKNLTQVNGGGDELNPSWSPDGKWIAFLSNRDGDYKLYKMRADGSDVTRVIDITVASEAASQISWGPRP